MIGPWRVNAAARRIGAGGVIAYPTESVYGLGCAPADPIAVARLLGIKGRQPHKGLILIAHEFTSLSAWVSLPDSPYRDDIAASWPGPTTWVLPARPGVPQWISGGRDSVAVRVTAHPLAAALCRAVGEPIVSTSANRSGQAPLQTALAVRRQLGSAVDYVLGGQVEQRGKPTAIRDGVTGDWIRRS